jgi:hypothetical protein
MSKKRQSYVEFVGTDVRIPVPDDPEGERAAVAAHPAFRAMVERARRDFAAGKGIPTEALREELGLEPPPGRRPRGRRAAARWTPPLLGHLS